MIFRRMRSLANLDPSQLFKISALIFISSNIVILIIIAILYFTPDNSILPVQSGAITVVAHLLPAVLWCFNALCAGLLALMWRRCHNCRHLSGKQIITAMDKMSKGDLGWKITLRRGNELSEVAESVSHAHEQLVHRIAEIQTKAREISEVEDFLFDSIEMNRSLRPLTLKALRKLKIGLNRLKSDIDGFQLSLVTDEKDRQDLPTSS